MSRDLQSLMETGVKFLKLIIIPKNSAACTRMTLSILESSQGYESQRKKRLMYIFFVRELIASGSGLSMAFILPRPYACIGINSRGSTCNIE